MLTLPKGGSHAWLHSTEGDDQGEPEGFLADLNPVPLALA
jgi:hypothetical protein